MITEQPRDIGVVAAQNKRKHPAQVAAITPQQRLDRARFTGLEGRHQTHVVGLVARAVSRRRCRYQAQHTIHAWLVSPRPRPMLN